jgi:hypothetical protein
LDTRTVSGTNNNRPHSTEIDKFIPKSLELKPKTIEDLLAWAERTYGFDRDQVRKIMLAYNIDTFLPENWFTYTGFITEHRWQEEAQKAFPLACPICGSETERNTADDDMYGARWGWRCIADRFHFALHQWAHLKPMMVNRPDVLQFGYEESEIERHE